MTLYESSFLSGTDRVDPVEIALDRYKEDRTEAAHMASVAYVQNMQKDGFSLEQIAVSLKSALAHVEEIEGSLSEKYNKKG